MTQSNNLWIYLKIQCKSKMLVSVQCSMSSPLGYQHLMNKLYFIYYTVMPIIVS